MFVERTNRPLPDSTSTSALTVIQAPTPPDTSVPEGFGARLVAAADRERRRIERDLHDGAQQRLVSLSLRLGLLSTQLTPGSEAEHLLADARQELADSLQELRELARGVHPAILSDHGLATALKSLASRAPVPVELDVELEQRPPEAVEVAAYYLVCEALTNVAKYAHATTARVSVQRRVTGSSWRSSTTAMVTPTPPPAPGCAASRTALRRSAAGSRSRAQSPAERR